MKTTNLLTGIGLIGLMACYGLVPKVHYKKKFLSEVEEGIEQPFESPTELDRYVARTADRYTKDLTPPWGPGAPSDPAARAPSGPKKWAAQFRQSDEYKAALAKVTERHMAHMAEQASLEQARIAEEQARIAEEQARIAKEQARAVDRQLREAQQEHMTRAAEASALSQTLADSNPRLKATIDKNGSARLSDLKTPESVVYFLAANSWIYTTTGSDAKKRYEFFLHKGTEHYYSETATSVPDRFDGYQLGYYPGDWGGDERRQYLLSRNEYRDTGESHWLILPLSERGTALRALVLQESGRDIVLRDTALWAHHQQRLRSGSPVVRRDSGWTDYARLFRGGIEASGDE